MSFTAIEIAKILKKIKPDILVLLEIDMNY